VAPTSVSGRSRHYLLVGRAFEAMHRRLLDTLRAEVAGFHAANAERLGTVISMLSPDPAAAAEENKELARLVQDLANRLDVQLRSEGEPT